MNRLCRMGLHCWRFTDWSYGDVDQCGYACARRDCRRLRGSADRLTVVRDDRPVVIPPEFLGAFVVPAHTRLVRVPAPGEEQDVAPRTERQP